jgi:uncharacterized repeat protein (TIGR01451 family)
MSTLIGSNWEDPTLGWAAFFARAARNTRRALSSRVYLGRRLLLAVLAAVFTVAPAIAVGTGGAAGALSGNFFDYQNHDVATSTAGLVDWGNNGALTSSTALGSTWSRAGAQGIFNGGVYNGGTTPPTPPSLTATGQSLVNSGAIQSAAFVADPLASDKFSCNGTTVSGDPTTFTGSGSETNNGVLSTFTYGTAGNTPPKDEISNVYALAHNDGSTHEIFFGGERVVNNGASHIDFEFLQAKLAIPDPCKAGTMTGHRTQRDLLLSTDFTNGGALNNADLYTWSCNGAAPGTQNYDASKDFTVCDPPANGQPHAGDPQYVKLTNQSIVSFGVNTGANGISCGGWVCRDGSGTGTSTLLQNTLMEGGIDLAAAGFNGCVNTFLPHTRTSPAFTSVLKDFAGPIAFSNCKSPTVTTSQSADGASGANVSATVPTSVTDTATLHGAASAVKGSVTYTLYSDASCTQVVGTSTKTINGTTDNNGDLVLPSSDPVAVNAAGTYYWTAAYSGDTNLGGQNNAATSPCGSEVLTAVAPSLSITKTADAAQVSAGDAIGFTVNVTNNGQGTAKNVTINDPLPGGPDISWSMSPAYSGQGSCSITGAPQTQTLTCSLGNLAPAASASVHVTSSTTRASCAVYNNTATVSADNNGPVPPAKATTTVQCPTLTITKTADASSVSAGQDIGFTITVHNGGAGTAKSVTLTDPLPTGNGISWSIDPANAACNIANNTLSCSFGDLAPGASASVHVKSPTVFASCATYPNTASAQATNSPKVEATASVSVQCPGLQITKTADAPSVSAGDPIGFTIKVSNAGPGTATGVTLQDQLPSGSGVSWSMSPAVAGCAITGSPQTLNCTFGDLASGASVTVHVTSATIAASCGVYPNTAKADATNHAEVTASATTTVNCPNLTINKTADAPLVDAGDNIGFTITVGNSGAGVAKSATLNDPLPAGAGINWAISPAYAGPGTCGISAGTLSCAFGDLAPGATAAIHIVSATTIDTPCTVYTNVASAQATNNAKVTASASTTVQCPALHITKTADAPSVNAGEPIGFTITVTNVGAGNAKGVTITDVLPGGTGVNWSIVPANPACSIAGTAPNQLLNCSFGTLAPNASASVHITSATERASCATYVNTAFAAASNAPTVSATAPTTVNCPNLTINKTADSSAVSAGSPIGFTITVGNTGPGVAKNVTLNDPLPGGAGITWSIAPPVNGCSITGSVPSQTLTCSFGDMAAGASHVVHVTSPTSADTPCSDYKNIASAKADNNPVVTAQATTSVQCPGLHILKTADAATVNAGDPIGFTITVFNDGAGTATNVTVHDTLPSGSGVTWSINPAEPGCSIAPGSPQVLTCSFGDMAPEVSHSVHVTSATTFASCALYPNTATASADNTGSVQASASTTVNCPNLTITKTADAPTVSAGDPIGFTITVNNSGAGTAKNVVVDDPLPAGTDIAWTISPAVAGCNVTAGTLHCSFGDLAPGASASVHITSPTTFASCAAYPNTATVGAANHQDVVAHATTTVQCPNLSITKTADATPVSTGDPIGFLVTVSNSGAPGTGTAKAVTLNDPLPAGNGVVWTINPAYAGPGTCSITGAAPTQTLQCSFGDLAPGATVSVHITSATTAASAGTYPNTATAKGTNTDTVHDSATIVVLAPALSITKVADATPVNTGDPIGFAITVKNSAAPGTGTAKAVTLNDPLPAGNGISWTINPAYAGPGTCSITGAAPTQTLQCSFGDLAPGATVSVHIASATTAASAGTYPNTATAKGTNTDTVHDSATIVVVAPNLTITKTADAATVSAGSSIGFTVTVGNAGPGTARSVTLDDPLPAGNGITWIIKPAYSGVGTCAVTGTAPTQSLQCSFGDLGAGASTTVHVTSTTAFASCAQYTNIATASTTNGTSVNATASTTVQCPALTITKTADHDTVSAGSAIGFTIQVSNAGPGTATGVTVSDPLPTGAGIDWSINPATPGCGIVTGTLTCSFGDLGAESSRSVHITSPTTFTSCAEYLNKATATATNHPDVQAQATTNVECPSLSVTKTADATPVNTGDQIGFTVTVSNAGPGTAVNVTLNDPLPSGKGVDWSIDPANPACHIDDSASGQTLKCAFGDLAADASASVHIVSATTAASGGTYDNTATALADNAPSVDASATVVVLPPALNITKVADDAQVTAGEKIGFTVTVSNSDAEGTGIARAVTLSDPLPGGDGVDWSINPAYSGPGTCSIAGTAPKQTLGCSFGDMAPGASASVHIESATTSASLGRYDNTAVAATTNGSPVQATATTAVIEESPVTVASVPTTTTTTTTVASTPPVSLPFTGGDTARLAAIGAFLVATGTALFLGRRRRSAQN